MKTKAILLVLFGLLASAFFGSAVASVTSQSVGMIVFVVSALSMTLPKKANVLYTLINFSGVTWSGKEVMDMTEATMEAVYSNPELTSMNQVVENIVARQQIVFLGSLSKISKKSESCGGSAGSHTITSTEKYWDPIRTKFWLEQCADDLEETFWVWGLNKGIARKDLTQGDFATFIMTRIEQALVEDIQRIAWFNDVDHDTVDNSPGLLTSGISILDYNMLDGFWSQIYDIVGLDADRRYEISENALSTYALQDALATDRAVLVLRNLYQNADKRLKHNKDKFFVLTDSLVDNYQTWLESQGVDSSFTRVQAGERGQFDTGLRFRGIPIYCFDFWDRTIRADFDNGASYYQPHRAILTVKENLPIGVDGVEATKSMTQFYLPKEETTNWKGGYKIDAKVLLSYMIQVAY